MIGGYDYEMTAPAGSKVGECVIAIMRHHWPAGVIVAENEDDAVPLASPDATEHASAAEFFVFSDRKTANEWDELGPCPENWNRMIHVLWEPESTGEPIIVTLV